MTKRTIPISELRRRTSTLVDKVRSSEEPVYITLRGHPALVLLDYDAYKVLMARLEDLADLVSLRHAADEPARPYEEFLVEVMAEREQIGGARWPYDLS